MLKVVIGYTLLDKMFDLYRKSNIVWRKNTLFSCHEVYLSLEIFTVTIALVCVGMADE
jgi:hypothetical protein